MARRTTRSLQEGVPARGPSAGPARGHQRPMRCHQSDTTSAPSVVGGFFYGQRAGAYGQNSSGAATALGSTSIQPPREDEPNLPSCKSCRWRWCKGAGHGLSSRRRPPRRVTWSACVPSAYLGFRPGRSTRGAAATVPLSMNPNLSQVSAVSRLTAIPPILTIGRSNTSPPIRGFSIDIRWY